jgi:hypothetical protein
MAVPLVDPIAPINGPPVSPGMFDSVKCEDGARKWMTTSQMAAQGCRSLGIKTQTGNLVQYQACCPLIVKGPGGGTYVPETMPLKPMPSAENLVPGPIEQVAPGKVVVANGNVVPGVSVMPMMQPEGFKPYTPTPAPTTEALFNPNMVVMAPPLNIPPPAPTMDPGPNVVMAPPLNIPDGNGDGLTNGNGNGVTTTVATAPAGPNWWLWGGLGLAAGAVAWYLLRGRGTTRTG